MSSGKGMVVIDMLKGIFVISGWVVSLCLHEFGHALAAYLGGDYSVKESGYLSLNPLKYTHPLFSIIMPIIFVLLGGIGLPGGAVYVNRQVLPSRSWHSLVSAAGPLGTIAFSLVIMLPFFLGLGDSFEHLFFWSALADLALLQITALIFNIIPIPPLDGFGIVAPWLPDDIVAQAYRLGYLPFMLFLFLLWQDGPISTAFWEEVFRIADMLGIPYWF
jgi:Zn-dependent protease